eukprot:g16540.t1
MREFGYIIVKTLVTDITPAQKVRVAMNDIETSKRNRLAATEKADADKVMIVKRAEADAVSKYHQGAGIARQRKAIIDGMQNSVGTFQEAIEGMRSRDVLELVLITQYFDTLKEIAPKSAPRSSPKEGKPKRLLQREDSTLGGKKSTPNPNSLVTPDGRRKREQANTVERQKRRRSLLKREEVVGTLVDELLLGSASAQQSFVALKSVGREPALMQLKDWFLLESGAVSATTPLIIAGGTQQGKTNLVQQFFAKLTSFPTMTRRGDPNYSGGREEEDGNFTPPKVVYVCKPPKHACKTSPDAAQYPNFASGAWAHASSGTSSAGIGSCSVAAALALTAGANLVDRGVLPSVAEVAKIEPKIENMDFELAALCEALERAVAESEDQAAAALDAVARPASSTTGASERARLFPQSQPDEFGLAAPAAARAESQLPADSIAVVAPSTRYCLLPRKQLEEKIRLALRTAYRKASRIYGSFLENPLVLVLDEISFTPENLTFVEAVFRDFGAMLRLIWVCHKRDLVKPMWRNSALSVIAQQLRLRDWSFADYAAMLKPLLLQKAGGGGRAVGLEAPSCTGQTNYLQPGPQPEQDVKVFLQQLVRQELFHGDRCNLRTMTELEDNCVRAFARFLETPERMKSREMVLDVSRILKSSAPPMAPRLQAPLADAEPFQISANPTSSAIAAAVSHKIAPTGTGAAPVAATSTTTTDPMPFDFTAFLCPAVNFGIVAGYLAMYNPKDADRLCLLTETDRFNNKKIPNKLLADCGLQVGRIREQMETRQARPCSVLRVRAIFEVLVSKHQMTVLHGCCNETQRSYDFWHVYTVLASELKLWSECGKRGGAGGGNSNSNNGGVSSAADSNPNYMAGDIISHVGEKDVHKALEKLNQDPTTFMYDYLLTMDFRS